MSPTESQAATPEMTPPIPLIPQADQPPSPKDLEFETICRGITGLVFRTACWEGSPEPEDVSQEVLIRVWRSMDAVGKPPKSWLYTTTRRVVCDQWRRAQRRPKTDLFEVGSSELPSAIAPDDHATTEQRLIISSALAELPDIFREVVVLVDLKDTPILRAAEILGVSEGTVKSRVWRARKALRTALGDMGITSLEDIL